MTRIISCGQVWQRYTHACSADAVELQSAVGLLGPQVSEFITAAQSDMQCDEDGRIDAVGWKRGTGGKCSTPVDELSQSAYTVLQ